MLEIVLTREDANTEYALLAEWLVADETEVERGQPVCVVETTKATVEIEAPGSGTIVQLYGDGVEVELGRTIAYVAETADELGAARAGATGPASPEPRPAVGSGGKVTKKAAALADLHGVDLSQIDKRGFVTEKDVEALLAERAAAEPPADRPLLAGLSTEGVTLPEGFSLEESVGLLDVGFLDELRADPDRFRALSSAEKCAAYRDAGAVVGEGVVLGDRVLLDAPRIVLGDRVSIEEGGTVRCGEVFTVGAVTRFGPGLEVACRRAFFGAGIHAGRSVRFGGGGHRDPWAVLAVGDLAFLGDEIFVNVCRPVLVGREVFLTMRAMIVTHNIGHSVLEGFENRFAPVVLEDRSQIGLGTVVYAGCRVGAEAIVASGSYVVGDVPSGAFAIGVPAKVTGSSGHALSRGRQIELGRRMVDELHELLVLRGHDVSPVTDGDRDAHGFELTHDDRVARILFSPAVTSAPELAGADEVVCLTLDSRVEDLPPNVAVLDLLARRLDDGGGGRVLDSVREFCRKRGIRLEPGPWRYPGGLV
jgi:acetyltransferase-like isoleucine patch superfamily enzyme/nicotinamide mononucleotide (NMN) deamidase PncC